jgi:hypothetical protein
MEYESSAIAGMIIPDALTPGQYYDGIRGDDVNVRPIKRLMLAVLEDAMRCYQTYGNSRNRSQRRLFLEAEGWLMDRKGDGPFAFETVCETLGIDPNCLREGLRRWRLQQLDGLNPRRLARRSPVTRAGRISAPLRRRRRNSDEAAANLDTAAIAENRNEQTAAVMAERPASRESYPMYNEIEDFEDSGSHSNNRMLHREVQEAAA